MGEQVCIKIMHEGMRVVCIVHIFHVTRQTVIATYLNCS